MEHCKCCKVELKDFAHTLPEGLFCSQSCMHSYLGHKRIKGSNGLLISSKEYIDLYSEYIALESICTDETRSKTLYHKAGVALSVGDYKTNSIRCLTLEEVPKDSFGFLISFSITQHTLDVLSAAVESNDIANTIFTNGHLSVAASCITYPDTTKPIDPLVDYLKHERTRYVFVHSTDITGALKKILLLEHNIIKIKESLQDPNIFYNLV